MNKVYYRGGFGLIGLLILILIVIAFWQYNDPNGSKDAIDSALENLPDDINNIITTDTKSTPSTTTGNLLVANWNLQIFGQTKAANDDLMNYYMNKIDDYDIIFIQEIRDIQETAFPKLCSMLPEYNCITSSRAGRSTSKEQYGVIYKNDIQLLETIDHNPDDYDRWERPPLEVKFLYQDTNYTFFNIHVKPDDVSNELRELEFLINNREDNIIVIGDLNADCTYFDIAEKSDIFKDWNWIIPDYEDTTVSATDCAYDRFISNFNNIYNYGIMNDVIKEQSDHYLIWMEI